jgi:hypothetical protein
MRTEKEKAAREGRPAPADAPPAPASAPAASAQPASSSAKPASAYSETRLRLQTPAGTIQKSFPVDSTLEEVAVAIAAESGVGAVQSFTQNFPRKTFRSGSDFQQTLKEAGLVPSAALIVQ